MHEKLGDRTINAVYFRLCEPFQNGALVGSLYYVLDRENLSSRCPLPPWPCRNIMFLCERICHHYVPYHPGRVVLLCSYAREIFRLNAPYHLGWVVLLCSCAREFVVTMSLTTLAGSYYYVLAQENLSSRCPLPPWLGRTTMFLCERIFRLNAPYHPGWIVLLCSCARIFRHDVPYHPGRVVQLCSCAREFVVTMSLTTLAGSYNSVLVRENFLSQCPLPHPQIYLNCHLDSKLPE